MSKLEENILNGLNLIGYNGPLLQKPQFPIRTLLGIDEEVNAISSPEDSVAFVMEITSFLKELNCPYTSLTHGLVSDRLQNVSDRLLLLDYLITELMTARILQEKKPEKNIELKLQETPEGADMRLILQTLRFPKPPPNISITTLFEKLCPTIPIVLNKAGADIVGDGIFKGFLSNKQWDILNDIQKDLNHEYKLRREMLLTRLDVTIQSFQVIHHDWINSGIPGNEKADELARFGSEGRCLGPEPYLGITRQQVTAALNDWVYSTLKEHWRLSRGCRQARDFVTGPDPARSIWILGRSQETLNKLVGILTGHCKLRRHLSLLGIEEDPTCPRCGEDDETSYHFWSDRTKGKDELFEKIYHDKRKLLKVDPDVDISNLLAARTDLAIIEKTSSSSVRTNTRSRLQKLIIGQVPDRGGRTSEIAPPPPEMPSWQQQRSSGPQGGRGGAQGGRGGAQGGRGGGRGTSNYSRGGGNAYAGRGGGNDYSSGGGNAYSTGGGNSYSSGGGTYQSRGGSANYGNEYDYNSSRDNREQSSYKSYDNGGYAGANRRDRESGGTYSSQDYQQTKRAKTYDSFQANKSTYADQYVQESQHNQQYHSRGDSRDSYSSGRGRSNYHRGRGGGGYR
ncbi:hypothetical protein NQ317_003423 [Molorchus minor]|uniref:RNase H type-1 domain-containing protein n=1 Tax=Molorchus minor TaxID=1323400 RepID=A0ABQ9JUX8_9CUCU|nr:hypothetical protein NQ317_003423 [Molorchus minor]